ncbi:alpha/beta hydrolase, partial [Streptomyces fulvissimus]|nr:alpha/beta hydrolase [Streptomyces microflavus]
VLTVAASLSACSDSGTDEPGSQNGSTPAGGLASQKLDWSKCPAPDDTQGGGTAPSPLPGGTAWQCATMKAPLDW